MTAERRVLVTGASGMVGRHVVPLLLARGYEVHALARRPPDGARDVAWHGADLADHAVVTEAVTSVRPSHLLHLAWRIHGDYYHSPENVSWLSDSLHLLQVFGENDGRRFVGAGSASEYDLHHTSALDEETSPLRPNSLYGECKKALGQVGTAYGARMGVGFAWGRIFPCYGPGEHASRLVPSLLDRLSQGERIPFEEGLGVRDYVYVKDVAEAFVEILGSTANGPVNIGTGIPTTLRAFVGAVAEIAAMPGSIDLGAVPAPSYEPVRIVAATARIRRETGWRPRWSLQDGLRETVRWWRSEHAAPAEAGAGREAP